MGLRTAQEIVEAWEKARSDRQQFEGTWQQIADHELGMRDFSDSVTPGRQRYRYIYDSTSLQGAGLLAGGLHGLLTNPAAKWFSFRTEDDRLMENHAVRLWLENAEKVTLNQFSSPRSHFVTQISEVYLDVVSFGTAALWMDYEDRFLRFSARPLQEVFLSENFQGEVDTIFRHHRPTARQLAQQFGKDRLPDEVSKHLETDPTHTFELIHLVHPNPDVVAGALGPRGMRWRSVYVLALGSPRILEEGGFRTKPWMTPRWSKEAGETYGRSPGWTALSDQKMLNEMAKTILKAGQKIADPPLMVPDDGVMGKIQTAPNSLNVIRREFLRGTSDPIRPFPTPGAQFPITIDLLTRWQNNVRTAFFSQLLQLFEDPRMTATQVVELSNQAQRLMAPMLGRQQVELLEPMMDRSFDLLLRDGAYGPPPQELTGQNIRVDYVSPVTRAQRASEGRSVLETWNSAAVMGQVSPEVFDNMDPDESIRIVADAAGTPARVMRNRGAMAALRQARAEAQARQLAEQQAREDQQTALQAAPAIIAAGGAPAAQ